jgi:hypothetical protein
VKLRINKLKVFLPENPFSESSKDLNQLSIDLDHLAKKAGTGNNKFRLAYSEVHEAIRYNRPVVDIVNTPIHVRALAMSLQSDIKNKISFTQQLLNKITAVVVKPSALLIESIYQHFLSEFDKLTDCEAMAKWLLDAKKQRNYLSKYDNRVISIHGPQWVAKQAIDRELDFDHWLVDLGVEHYANGRYLTVAKSIYYVEQLKGIPLGSDHPLLAEVQKMSVSESQYDSENLLGHKVLRILIGRSSLSRISESWMNTVLAIAGDPRIPSTHPRYIKWWKQIDPRLIQLVRGWLSRLDLKLFLEALENYSYTSSNYELRRMYPSRKQFLEGMFDAGVITHTRLYMSRDAICYLKRNYDVKHLPNFSSVRDGDKSIIYVQMDGAHMIEGSHSCYLWLYRDLDPSICVFNYNISEPTYSQLTSGINSEMLQLSSGARARITHSPSGYSWQRKALTELRSLGVNLTPKDVLSSEDYLNYKQKYGVREWS